MPRPRACVLLSVALLLPNGFSADEDAHTNTRSQADYTGVTHRTVPCAILGANACVICRPRHSKPLHCICHRQRAGALTQRATLVGLITRMIAAKHAIITKKKTPSGWMGFLFGCGGRTRTYDLRVMSGDIPNFFNLKIRDYLRVIKNNRTYLSSNKIRFPQI